MQFGLLTALCMTVAAAGALLIVPAILRLLSAKRYRFLHMGTAGLLPPGEMHTEGSENGSARDTAVIRFLSSGIVRFRGPPCGQHAR